MTPDRFWDRNCSNVWRRNLTDIATIDMAARMEGRSMTMVVVARSEVVKQAQASRTVKAGEKERDKKHEEVEEAEAKRRRPMMWPPTPRK